MRAIWKGAVSFGLVNVPVRVAAATGTQNVKFNQVHTPDGGRIKYKRVCEIDGEEVEYRDISKGYQTEDGSFVVLTDEDMASLPLSSSREIDVVQFVPADQVDPLLFDSSYYLQPDSAAAKPYALLREALSGSDLLAVVKVALRQRESLAVLRVHDDVICLHTLLWPDEVRTPDFEVLPGGEGLRDAELAMAASLVESMTGDFDPDEYTDGYTAAVHELIDAKVSSGDVTSVERPDESGDDAQVLDLLTALQRSVDRASGRSSGTAAPADPDEDATPGARTTATKTPRKTAAATKTSTAKRSAAKTSAAKTSAAKKPAARKSAAKTPAVKTSAAKTSATKTPAAKKPAAKASARKTPAAKKTTAEASATGSRAGTRKAAAKKSA